MATDPLIGTRIKRARERKRMTQAQLAEMVGVSVRAVGDWENDRAFPRNSIGALEQALGIQLDDPESSPSGPRESLRDQVRRIEDLARELRARLDEEEEGRNHDRRRRGA